MIGVLLSVLYKEGARKIKEIVGVGESLDVVVNTEGVNLKARDR